MDRLLAVPGNDGQPLRSTDWEFIQDVSKTNFKALIDGLGSQQTQCVITGLVRTYTNNKTHIAFSEGYIYVDGEIFYVPAAEFDVTVGTYYLEPDFSTTENRSFKTAATHNVIALRRYKFGQGAELPEGGIWWDTLFTLQYLLLQAMIAQMNVTQFLGPMAGTKYEAFNKGIKFFSLSYQYQSSFFYISKFEVGIPVNGNYVYNIEISRTGGLLESGYIVLRGTKTSATHKTGWETIDLGQVDNSGIVGMVIVDWAQLTNGTTYVCSDWKDGGLFAVNTYRELVGTGGGEPMNPITDDFDIDGSLPIYLFKGTHPQTGSLAEAADWKCDAFIKNASGFESNPGVCLTIDSKEDYRIDGLAGLVLHPGGWIKIMRSDDIFEAYGVGYEAIPL